MPHRRAVPWSIRNLLALFASPLVSVSWADAGEDGASTTLAEPSRIVPNYVTQYAPLVWLHSDDPFRPADLLKHIRHTTPTVDQEPLAGFPELNLDNLAILNDAGDRKVALTSKDDVTALPAWLLGEAPDASGRIHNATACVVILVEQAPGHVDAFFFYFYSYDRGANITQVMPPFDSMVAHTEHGMHFGDHIGDWEHNMVRFQNGKPTGIYYSQHSDGAAYAWDDATLSMRDERPIVYSAYGSHANYPDPGDHVHDTVLIDYCDAGMLWDPVLSAYFYRLDPSSFTLTRIFPDSADSATSLSNYTSFFYYNGIWGDAQYPDSNPLQKTIPRFGLKRFVSGPTGPADKQLLRKGLFPDRRSKKSWLQWGVALYMSWYPCCIRGWRVWISGIVLIGLLVSTVYGARLCVRKYRVKGYTKVGTEIPMSDLNGIEEGISHDALEDER